MPNPKGNSTVTFEKVFIDDMRAFKNKNGFQTYQEMINRLMSLYSLVMAQTKQNKIKQN